MAAGRLAAPGTEFGPCVDKCEHRDCAATVRTANAICHHCDEPIGWDSGFFAEDDGSYVHELCELEAIERERAER